MENKSAQPLLKVKIAIILAYSALIISLLFLYVYSPVTGYELSIYTSIYPFWIFIFIAISIAITLLVYQTYKKIYIKFWYIYLILLISLFIILTLPISRGYYLYGSNDAWGHFGRVVKLVSSGNIGDNYYPISHILGAQLTLFCSNIPIQTIISIIPPIFDILFILFTYYLARVIFNREDYSIMAAVLSFIPLFSYYHIVLYPHAIAIFLLPLTFYLYFNSNKGANFKFIFFITLVLQAFVHVIPVLIIFGCLISAEVIKIIINRFNMTSKLYVSFSAAVMSLIVFFVWWSSYSIFGQMNKAYTWLVGESAAIPRTEEVNIVSNQGSSFFIGLFLKMYGPEFLLTILSIIAIAVIFIYHIKRKENVTNILILSIILLSSALIYVTYFLSSGFATIGRFLGANYGVWAMPIVTAFLLDKIDKSKMMMYLISFVIIIIIIISTLSIYRSDWISQPNWQITNSDVIAYAWQNMHIPSLGLPTGIIASPWGTLPVGDYSSWYAIIPSHFGYDNNRKLGDYISKDSIIYYGESRQKQATNNDIINNSRMNDIWALPGFNNDDYYKLYLDNSVNFLYSNGDVKILLVKGLIMKK